MFIMNKGSYKRFIFPEVTVVALDCQYRGTRKSGWFRPKVRSIELMMSAQWHIYTPEISNPLGLVNS